MNESKQPEALRPSPKLMRELQIQTEGGALLCSNYVGGYDLLTGIYQVIAKDLEAQHLQELAAYELTVGNLRARNAELEAEFKATWVQREAAKMLGLWSLDKTPTVAKSKSPGSPAAIVDLLQGYKTLCIALSCYIVREDGGLSERIEDAIVALQAAPSAPAILAEAYEKELSKVSLRNYDLRMEKAALVASLQAQAQEHATQLAGQGQDETMQALSDLTNALRERHHGRMPEEVQRAYDKAWAIVFAGQHAAAPAQAQDVQQDAVLPKWWPDFIQNVTELPDRNSPEDEPDAMIATAEELGACAIAARAAQGGAA